MKVEQEQLKSFLLDSDLIEKEKLKKVFESAKKTNRTIQDILISEGLIAQEELIKLEAYILGIPFVNLEKEIILPDILKIIPEPIARNNNIIAFKKINHSLEVAMLDPEDLRTIEFLKKTANLKILPRLTTPESIKNALKQYQKTLEVEFGEIIKKEASTIRQVTEGEEFKEKEDLLKAAEDLPIIRIVDTLMKHAILQRSSDIHIEPTEKEMIVRYRIDGILHDAMILPKQISQGVVARIKVLSNLKLDEHRLPQDGRFKIETEDYRYSIRVSVLPVFDGEKIVMRLLPETSKAISLEGLGLMSASLERVETGIRKPVGIILVTGPTGSGKTTTLYSMMEILNKPGVNISTIEDPIEYRMERVNQTQINAQIGLTFASGLRALVRQDPDILMVGEIRDSETSGLAINAALTGHLVLSTLHTTDASGAIPRLIDMGAEPFLIASTLNMVIAQRLVRKLCDAKEPYKLKEADLVNIEKYCNLEHILQILKEEKIVKEKDNWKDIVFYKPKATKECPEGYKGRIGILEVLQVTETIKNLIVKEATSSQIQEQAKKEGMITMVEDGFIKAVKGITSIEEVLRVIIE